MHIHSAMRLTYMAFFALFVSGCTFIGPGSQDGNVRQPLPADAKSGVNALLAFGASMASMSSASQADLCKSLLDTQKTSPSDGVQLHLMVGRLLSNSCGDIPQLIDDINAIKRKFNSDENLQRFISLNTQVLANMQAQAVKLDNAKHDQQKVKSMLDAKGEKKKETRILREKLEAIRSMEKQLDESSNNN
ncbi:hypothetical protein [Methylomonas sp. MgM2]